MKKENIPPHVLHDLVNDAEYPIAEVLSWTPEEVFEKYCEWHGLLGWHNRLWNTVEHLFRNSIADKFEGTVLDSVARTLAGAAVDKQTMVTIPLDAVFMLMDLAADSARVRATLKRQ